MPTSCGSTSNAPASEASHSPALNPAKMPMPPSIGVGASCQRSRLGRATSRRASGDLRSSQIATAEAGSATIATALLTGSERNGRPLARCEHATPPGRRGDGELPVAPELLNPPAGVRERLRDRCVGARADDDVAQAPAVGAAERVERGQEDDAPRQPRAPEEVCGLVWVEDGADAGVGGDCAVVR